MLTGYFRSTSGLRHRRSPALEAQWIFTDRAGGVSAKPYDSLNVATHVGDDPQAVSANREAVGLLFDSPVASVSFMDAEHGARTAVVSKTQPCAQHPCDALLTADVGMAVASLAADCVPVCLADVDAGVVAALHCGWQGVVADVAAAAVEAMVSLGAKAVDIQAVAGPAICADCYPVDPQRAEMFAAVAPEAVRIGADDQPRIDVRAAVVRQLAGLGVTVNTAGGCTRETPEFFSYRRDGRTGRHSGVIALSEAL